MEILTTNSVAYADTDGDGILDSSDEYPRDKFNGSGPTGIPRLMISMMLQILN